MEDKKEFHLKTSKWSDNIESALKNIADSCKSYKWMNIFSAKKESFRYDLLMYSLIVLGPVSGILSSTSKDNASVSQILVTIFSFSTGVFSAIIKFSRFDEKSLIHKTFASKYGSLESNIRRQLSLERNDRVNAGEYLEWISNNYEGLFSSSPLINDDVFEKWAEFSKKDNPEKTVSIHIVTKENDKENDSKEKKTSLQDTDNANIDVYADGKMKYELSRFYGKN